MGNLEKLRSRKLSSNICEEDQELLVKYASKIKDGYIVDFGTGTGFSALILALASPTSEVVSFDVREMGNRHGNFHRMMGHDKEYLKKLNKLKEEYKADNLTISIADSLRFSPKRDVDLINIDSSHEYEHTKKEIARWKVFVDGYFIFHDYNNLDSIKRAVDESFDKSSFIENKGLSQIIKYDGPQT